MSWLSDALKFDRSWLKDQWKGIKSDPKRLVLGVDPVSTAGWNAVLGREDQPLTNEFGGPTEQSYQNAEAQGINTGPGRTAHGVAKTIAGFYGMQGLGGGGNTDLMRIAAMGQGGGPAPVSAPAGAPPSSQPPQMPVMNNPMGQGPQPVMTGRRGMNPAMLAQILRSGGGRFV